ncbi:hypothetical protein Aduo_001397 [Ancylostoma duodenale]
MAAATATAFACTYGTCPGSSDLKLNCIYKKVLKTNNTIYYKAPSEDKICSDCNSKLTKDVCIQHLCQQQYTFPGDIPTRKCTQYDGMSNNLQAIAVDMHNYYRRLVATGWKKSKNGYVSRAKAMLGLKYQCGDKNNTIGTDTKALVDSCNKTAPTATNAYSLNYFYKDDYQLSREELLKEAITKWVDEASAVGEDNKYTKGAGFDNYANMMNDKVKEVTCAVNVCTKTGNSAVACQYNAIPGEDDVIYELGTPCKGCPTGTTCDNSLGGGLCV